MKNKIIIKIRNTCLLILFSPIILFMAIQILLWAVIDWLITDNQNFKQCLINAIHWDIIFINEYLRQ